MRAHALRTAFSCFALCLIPVLSGCASEPLPRVRDAYASAGEHRVIAFEQEWYDASRSRSVPVRIYMPEPLAAPAPVIVFSHGLGNSREGYSYLGEQWASHGYISVHPESVGGNHEVEKHGLIHLYLAGKDPKYLTMFPADAEFAIARVADPAGPLAGRVDPTKIIVAGHSIGAYAALALAGLRAGTADPTERSFHDGRVVAIIPMSMSERFPAAAYRDIRIPVLHMTGTHDSSIAYGTLQRERRVPFESISGAEQFLVTLAGANHSTFSDDESRGNAREHDIIRASTTAFLDAFARGDGQAKEWLRGGGFRSFAGHDARMEIKQ